MNAEPLAAGSYRLTVATESTPPDGCTTSDGASYDCQDPNGYGYGQLPGPTLGLCPSSATASVDFDLPSSGTVDVTVSVQ